MALMETLTDTFDANVGGLWTTYGTVVFDGQLKITATNSGLFRTNAATGETEDMTGSFCQIELVQAAGTQILYYMSDGGGTTWIAFNYDGTNIQAREKHGGTETALGSPATFSAVNHRFLKFRETAGTTFWETSPTGYGSWTTLHSMTTVSVPTTMTALPLVTYLGAYTDSMVGFNVKAYGAVGDYDPVGNTGTNDTAAFAAAITAAAGASVYGGVGAVLVPKGNYSVAASALNAIPNRVAIIGSGMGSTIYRRTGTNGAFIRNAALARCIMIANIRIDGNTARVSDTTADGIYLDAPEPQSTAEFLDGRHMISNVMILNTGRTAPDAVQPWCVPGRQRADLVTGRARLGRQHRLQVLQRGCWSRRLGRLHDPRGRQHVRGLQSMVQRCGQYDGEQRDERHRPRLPFPGGQLQRERPAGAARRTTGARGST
jgi:hypothetical protein